MKTYTVNGIKVRLDPEAMRKWSAMKLIARIDKGQSLAAVELIEKVLGDQEEAVLWQLDPESGDPDDEKISDFFVKLLNVMVEDVESKKSL